MAWYENREEQMDIQTMRQEIEATLINRAALDQDFRARLTADPKKTIGETFKLKFSPNLRVSVHEESEDELHLVLPVQLGVEDGDLSDEHLEAVAGGVAIASSSADLNIPSPNQSLNIVNTTLQTGPISTPAGATNPNSVPPITLGQTTVDANGNITSMAGTWTTVTPKGQLTNQGTNPTPPTPIMVQTSSK